VSRLVEWLQRPFPRQFSVISYHNHRLREYLIQHMRCAPDRLLRIQQGVDYQFFQRPRRAAGPIAIYAAHLNVASDLREVLQAWQLVIREIPAARLRIIGGGPLLAHYRRMAETMGLAGSVEFTGELAHAAVPDQFADAQAALLYMSNRLVNAYRCSLKLREYFAAGLKVVCNDVGELPEYAHLTYQTKSDLAEFAAMAVRVLRGHDDGRQVAAQKFAAEELDWPRLIAGAANEITARIFPA
jgi:glycosyltransferase involved in cell wall biosynthesis